MKKTQHFCPPPICSVYLLWKLNDRFRWISFLIVARIQNIFIWRFGCPSIFDFLLGELLFARIRKLNKDGVLEVCQA